MSVIIDIIGYTIVKTLSYKLTLIVLEIAITNKGVKIYYIRGKNSNILVKNI
jgi:hypothetical protein